MLLQIDVTGTDATGGVVSATIEVEVADRPAAEVIPQSAAVRAGWMSVPPGATAAASFPAPDIQARADPPPAAPAGHLASRLMAAGPQAPAPAQEVQVQAMEAQIPGLGNSTGHKGAVSDFVPPKVTQAQRSMTLGRFTGGYR